VKNQGIRAKIDLGQFYSRFLITFMTRLNQLALVRICIAIANQRADLNERIAFVKSIAELPKVKEGNEASVVVKSFLAELLITSKDLTGAKGELDSAKKSLDETLGADATVYAAMHRAFALYYKAKGESDNFYRSALQYVGYSDIDTLSNDEVLSVAFDLGIAALIAEKVYNFGDLMETEIVDKLKNSDHHWLWEVLQAFNRGDIPAWKQLQGQYKGQLNSQQSLLQNHRRLSRKISILALMEMVFSKPSDDRILSFSTIAKATEMTTDEVEVLVMHALSLGLIKGSIDQVKELVEVTWVQPRILSLPQIEAMGARLTAWGDRVTSALSTVQHSITPELIA
jgi:26S proteasome regulatory subunit N9